MKHQRLCMDDLMGVKYTLFWFAILGPLYILMQGIFGIVIL